MDDSIVRGTTLEKSVIRLLLTLSPKEIIIVSSAPQVRYPDFYGIDMSMLGEFIAFRALMALLKEKKKEDRLQEVYERCLESLKADGTRHVNHVKGLYEMVTDREIEEKISSLLSTNRENVPVQVIFQPVENLKRACPAHTGDWYFTGNYPTPYGNRGINKAFVNFMDDKSERSY